MKTVQTAEEFLSELDEKLGPIWTEDDEEICKAFIEFAKIHVKAALEAAAENAESYIFDEDGETCSEVRKESILKSYPLENIK